MRFRFRPPSLDQFPFGTDNFGRSLWSRVLWGAQLSMIIGISVVALNAVFGTHRSARWPAMCAALDKIIMGFNDAMMAFPAVLLAIGITAALGSSVLNVIIALSIVYVPAHRPHRARQRDRAARDGIRPGCHRGRRRALEDPNPAHPAQRCWHR